MKTHEIEFHCGTAGTFKGVIEEPPSWLDWLIARAQVWDDDRRLKAVRPIGDDPHGMIDFCRLEFSLNQIRCDAQIELAALRRAASQSSGGKADTAQDSQEKE